MTSTRRCRHEGASRSSESRKMISDPEFSYAPEPENVMKIYRFMHKVGALKTMPATWQDLFFPEAHALKGN